MKFKAIKFKDELPFIIPLSIVTLLVRLIFFNQFGVGISNDSYEYLSISHNVISNLEFNSTNELHSLKDSVWLKQGTINENKLPEFVNSDFQAVPTMFRVPGYILFTSLVFSIFGENINFIALSQIALQVLTVVILYLVALNFFAKGVNDLPKLRIITAILLLFFFCFHPGVVLSARNILRESFELFLFSYIFLAIQLKRLRFWQITLGFALGLLILTLPNYFPFLLFLLFIGIVVSSMKFYGKGHYYTKFGYRFLWTPLIIALIITQIWCLYNYERFGFYALSSYKSGAMILGVTMSNEAYLNNNDVVDLNRIIRIYSPSPEVIVFFNSSQTPGKQSQLRKFYRYLYVSSAEQLFKMDSFFLNLAFQIIKDNPKMLFQNLFRSLYGTFRFDFYASNFQNNQPGESLSSLPLKKILSSGPTIDQILAIVFWVIGLIGLISFIFCGYHWILKLILLFYYLPYSLSPAVEYRVTLIFILFIFLGFIGLAKRLSAYSRYKNPLVPSTN